MSHTGFSWSDEQSAAAAGSPAQTGGKAFAWSDESAPVRSESDEENTERSPAAPPSFLDTLEREGKAAGRSILGMPGAVYHAFADEPTSEEATEFGGREEVSGAKRIGLGIHRLTTQPIGRAVDFYTKAAKGEIPNLEEQMLSVAPEAIGSAAGNVIGGKLIESAPGVVSRYTPPVVRGLAKGTNAVLERAPGTIGASTGAAIGHATGVPYAGEAGAIVGGIVGPELLPKVRIPGEHFGFPDRVLGGPRVAPRYVEPTPSYPGAPLPEDPGVFPGAHLPETPAPEVLNPSLVSEARTTAGQVGREVIRPPVKPAEPIPARQGLMLSSGEKPAVIARPEMSPRQFDQRVNEIAGKISETIGSPPPLNPKAPIYPRLARVPAGEEIPIGRTAQAIEESLPPSKAPKFAPTEDVMSAIRASELPEGFTPAVSTRSGKAASSDAVLGYKNNPAAREFEIISKDRQHYVYGDVPPEAADKFASAESPGRAWKALQETPGVVQVKKGPMGRPNPTKPITRGEIPEGEEVPPGGVLRAIEESTTPKKSVIAKPAVTKPGASLKIGGKDVEPDTDLASALKKSIPAGKRPSPKTKKTGTQ